MTCFLFEYTLFSDSENLTTDVPYVLLNIISSKINIQLKILQGIESSSFVAEFFKVIESTKIEVYSKNKDFLWLQKYISMRNTDSNEKLCNTEYDEEVSFIFL